MQCHLANKLGRQAPDRTGKDTPHFYSSITALRDQKDPTGCFLPPSRGPVLVRVSVPELPPPSPPHSRRLLPIKPSSNSAAPRKFGLNKHKQRSKGSGKPPFHHLSWILRQGFLGCWLAVGTPQGHLLEQNIYKHSTSYICRSQLSPCSLCLGPGGQGYRGQCTRHMPSATETLKKKRWFQYGQKGKTLSKTSALEKLEADIQGLDSCPSFISNVMCSI